MSSLQDRLGVGACQVRMARAALRWTIEELACNSGISEKTIRRIEAYGCVPNLTLETVDKLLTCFQQRGITLISGENTHEGPGVRLAARSSRVA